MGTGTPHHLTGDLRYIHLWEQPPRDHQALNLRCSFEDVEYFRIAEPLGNELLALGILTGSCDPYRGCRHLHY